MKKLNRNLVIFFLAFLLLGAAGACKRYFDPPLIFEPEPDLNLSKDRKVLIVSIDGLSGLELKKYMPPVIKSLLANAKYSLDGFSDGNTGDASSWTTMLSGKSSAKHGVLGNSFGGDGNEGDPNSGTVGNTSIGYITVYQRLLESGKLLKSLSISPWNDLDQQLFYLSDENGTVSSDLAVKEKAVDRIKNGSDKLAFTVLNFRDLNKVGLETGFSMDNEAYKRSLDEIDAYLGEILDAVKARKKYATEDWLVIVTSNHGGLGKSYGGGSFEERKVPIIYYNPNFLPLLLEAPQLMNSLRISTQGDVESPFMTATNSLAYDLKNAKEYTIMFKVFNNKLPSGGGHAVVLGRTTHAYSVNRGWHFMIEGSGSGNRYRCLFGPGSGTSRIAVTHPAAAKINVWETIAATVYFRDGKRYGQVYVNGEPSPEVDLTGQNFETAIANFFIGSGNVSSIGTFDGKVNNLVFVDKALTDAEIKAFSCQQKITNAVSYWGNVRGYWPMNEGSGNVIHNLIPTVENTTFSLNASRHVWEINRSWNCFSPQENVAEEKKVISYSMDILPQVFYWLNIKTAASWGLEGTLFLTLYEREFIGK